VQDCQNHNPLIRALAIRTMSYIPLPAVFHALVDPLRHSLKDADPYVRKTGAICVAKLYFADSRLVERERFVESLRELLKDGNPTVIANAVAALSEISDRSDAIVFKVGFSMASKLVAALPECSECVPAHPPKLAVPIPCSRMLISLFSLLKMGSNLYPRRTP
jgi:AP-2 complex subunit beta-1